MMQVLLEVLVVLKMTMIRNEVEVPDLTLQSSLPAFCEPKGTAPELEGGNSTIETNAKNLFIAS